MQLNSKNIVESESVLFGIQKSSMQKQACHFGQRHVILAAGLPLSARIPAYYTSTFLVDITQKSPTSMKMVNTDGSSKNMQ